MRTRCQETIDHRPWTIDLSAAQTQPHARGATTTLVAGILPCRAALRSGAALTGSGRSRTSGCMQLKPAEVILPSMHKTAETRALGRPARNAHRATDQGGRSGVIARVPGRGGGAVEEEPGTNQPHAGVPRLIPPCSRRITANTGDRVMLSEHSLKNNSNPNRN
jgi:hypothetical protein